MKKKIESKSVEKRKQRDMRKEYTATFYQKNRKLFFITIVAVILCGIMDVGVAYLLQVLLDVANSSNTKGLVNILVVSLAFFCSMFVFQIVLRSAKYSFLKNAMKQYKEKVFENITRKNISTFASENTSSYISALTNDAASIERNYLTGIINIVNNCILFVGAIAMMFWYNWSMTLVVIGLCLLPISTAVLFGNKLAAEEKEISNKNESFVNIVKDLLNGFSVIKSFKAEKEAIYLFNEKNIMLENNKCKRMKTENLINIISGMVGFVVQIGIFLYGAYLSIQGHITAGVVVAFVQLMNYVLAPIQRLPGLLANKKAADTLIDKLALYTANNINKKGEEIIHSIGKGIICKNIRFGYEEKCIYF